MNFVIFNLKLLAAGIVVVFVFSFGVMACLAPLAVFSRAHNLPKAAAYPFVALAGAFQVYILGFLGGVLRRTYDVPDEATRRDVGLAILGDRVWVVNITDRMVRAQRAADEHVSSRRARY